MHYNLCIGLESSLPMQLELSPLSGFTASAKCLVPIDSICLRQPQCSASSRKRDIKCGQYVRQKIVYRLTEVKASHIKKDKRQNENGGVLFNLQKPCGDAKTFVHILYAALNLKKMIHSYLRCIVQS